MPVANTDSLLGLAEELVDVSSYQIDTRISNHFHIFFQDSGTVVQDNTASMAVVNREEVDARPLARVGPLTCV